MFYYSPKIRLRDDLENKYQQKYAYVKSKPLNFKDLNEFIEYLRKSDYIFTNKNRLYNSSNVTNKSFYIRDIVTVKDNYVLVKALHELLTFYYREINDSFTIVNIVYTPFTLEDEILDYIKEYKKILYLQHNLRSRGLFYENGLANPKLFILENQDIIITDGLKAFYVDKELLVPELDKQDLDLELYRETVFRERFTF